MIANKKHISYFDLLGLDEDATLDEVKSSFKQMAQIYHPDKYKNKEEKQEAEKKFKLIKKAYDELIAIYQKEEEKYQQLNDIYSNPEFIAFFANKNIDVEELKSKDYSKAYISKSINFMKEKIEYLNLDLRYVYNCISKSKLFISWQIDDHDELEKLIQKEIIYRNHVKSLSSYTCFNRNKKIFNNPDINLTIKIKPNLLNKKFNQTISYKIHSICSICDGLGCKYCKNGIINKEVSEEIYFSNIVENKEYSIPNLGSNLDIVTGNLNIKFVTDKNIYQDFMINQLSSNGFNFHWNSIINWFINLFNFVKNHKIHFIYLSIILVIIIVALLLIFLV